MAPTSSRNASHSTHAASGWDTRRIAVTALLCAMAAICTLLLEFPILPGVTWLKYDPSGIVALIAGFAFGPATGAVVSVIPYLVHIATASGIYGMIMAILATFCWSCPRLSSTAGSAPCAERCLALWLAASSAWLPASWATSS